MILTVSGFPASGTSTLCTNLVDELDGDVAYVNGGMIFRGMADKRGMTVNEFSKHVNNNPEIDADIDGVLRGIILAYMPRDNNIDIESIPVEFDTPLDEADYLLLESRLAAWIAGASSRISIWLDAAPKIRRNRAKNPGSSEDPENVIDREWDERMRYQTQYNIDIDDKSIYDLTLDTALWNTESITDGVVSFIKNYNESFDTRLSPVPNETKQFEELVPETLYR